MEGCLYEHATFCRLLGADLHVRLYHQLPQSLQSERGGVPRGLLTVKHSPPGCPCRVGLPCTQRTTISGAGEATTAASASPACADTA